MSNAYNVEYTDTFGGEANYSWVNRTVIRMPELTHYGYDGSSNYAAANAMMVRDLKRRAKAWAGLSGARGEWEDWGDSWAFRPRGRATILFVNWREEQPEEEAEA